MGDTGSQTLSEARKQFRKLRRDYHIKLLQTIHSAKDKDKDKDSIPGFSSNAVPDVVLDMGTRGLHYSDLLTQKYFGTNEAPNLPDYIHPIFQYDKKRWRNLPLFKYDRLKLGLRLASQLLLSSPCVRWWAKALFGKFHTNADGKKYLESILVTPLIEEQTKQIMTATAPYVEFLFCEPENMEIPNAYAETSSHYPRTWTVPEQEQCKHYCEMQSMPILITMNLNAVGSFQHLPDQDMELRMQFVIASTLLHELAHVVYDLTHLVPNSLPELNDDDASSLDEDKDAAELPYQEHSLLSKSEWGFELELALFNRLVFSIGTKHLGEKVPRFGLWAMSVSQSDKHNDDANNRLFQLVPMSWVYWWFRTDSIRSYNKSGLAAIPEMTMFWFSRTKRKIIIWK